VYTELVVHEGGDPMPGTWLLRALGAAALVLSATGCVGIGGETISLSHEKLRTPPSPASGAIPMPRSAEDVRGQKSRIGRATITVFAITSGSVVTRTPIGDEVSLQVADALRAAGYEVQILD